MKFWQRTIAAVATIALLFNGLIAPLSVLAQEETPSPTPETTEPTTTPEESNQPINQSTIQPDPTVTPEVTPDATPAETTPTPVITPTATDSATPTPTDQSVPTQSPESTPTVQGPPTASNQLIDQSTSQPTPTEDGHLSALILKDTKVDTSSIDEYDVTYRTDGSATIATDKLDYAPTDTAIITGVGFTAEKTYTINVTSTDKPAVYFSDSVKANDKGEIFYSYTLDGKYRPNYKVEIKDVERIVAVTTFTDATVSSISEDNFSIIVVPDTQNYTDDNPETYFKAQTQFIADNKDTLNIAYVAQEGDLVNSSSDTAAYTRAQTAMNTVKGASIPFGIVRGNHDSNSTTFNNYFGTSYHTYDGVYESGKNDNGYSLLTAKGVDYLIVNLSYNPSPEILNWADGILTTYSTRKAIVVSHSILNSSGAFTTEGTKIYNALSDKPNLFLMLCGHMHDGDGEAMKEDTGINGNKIVTLLADYQDRGNGLLRMMEFTSDNKVNVKTYAVATSAYETDADSQFTLDFSGGSSTPTPSTTPNPSSGWKAYNDSAWVSGQVDSNITKYTITSGNTSGLLKNYSTGSNTSVTATITSSGSPSIQTSSNYGGAETASGTDAYNTFHGIADMAGVIQYGSSSGWNVDVTFSGLDPSKKYVFATSANRDDSSYTDRNTKFTISDISSATNDSTNGVTEINNESVYFNTGDNNDHGYVARWKDIQPGSDGDFTVRAEANSLSAQYKAYAFSVFMLQEEGSGSGTPTPTPTSNCSTVNLVASEDTYMSSYNDDYNYGSVSLFKVTNNNNGNKRGGLIKWDVSSIPTNATVSNANVTLNVSTSSNKTYNLYNMRRNWVEGTLTTGATSTNSANWNTYDGSNSWGTVGAANTSSDRYDTNLWGAGTTSFSSTGSKTVALNTNGVDVVQGWISGTTTNYGLTIQNYSTTSGSDDLQISSSENTTVANRPSLNVTYCVPVGTPTPVPTTTPTPSATPTPVSSTVNLITTADTYMNSGSTKGKYNYGGSTTIQLNPYYEGGTNDQYRAPLLKWDLSSIPSNATINSASLTFYVTTGETAYTYNLYNLRRDWTEGTKDGATGTGASWKYYGAGTGSWGTDGAANTSSDRYNTNLWNATASDFGTTGDKTFNLNSDGISALQGWITTPANNFGLTIQNYSETATGSWIAASRENTSGYTKPTLNITYTVPPVQQTLSVNNDSHGTVTLNPTGGTYDNGTTVTLTPVANTGYVFDSWTGTNASDVVNTGGIYTIVMNGNKSVTATFKTSTTNVEPSAYDDSVTIDEDTNVDIDVLDNDHDDDGDDLDISRIYTSPTNGTASIVNNKIHYEPNLNYFGSDDFTYEISDNHGHFDTAAIHITITSVNDSPVAANDSYTVNEDAALTTVAPGVLSNDTDVEGTTLTASLVNGATNGSLTLNANGSFTYTPTANYNGSDSFTYRAYDGASYSSTATVSITINSINDAPIANTQAVTTNEETAKTITLTGSDVENSSLTYTVITNPTKGTLSGTAPNLTYTPSANYNGSDSFTFKVNDGSLDSATATVSITVNAANDAPVLASVGNKTVNELTNLTFTASATDIDSTSLTYSLSSAPTGASIIGNTGVFSFIPTEAQGPNTYHLTISVTDGSLTDSEAIDITVNEVNVAPVAQSSSASTSENNTVTITLSATDSDFPANSLTYSIVSGVSNGVLGPVTANHLTYTPNINYNGLDSFTFKANDGSLDSAPATVSITVTPVNNPPTANNDSYSTNDNTTLNISAPGILSNDNDIDSSTLTTVLSSTVSHGTLTLNSDGSFTYKSVANFNGNDSFTYYANDGTANSANTATVTINVTDKTAPVIASHSDMTFDSEPGLWGATVTYVLPTTDDSTASVTCSPASGTYLTVGEHTIYCDATDTVGNHALQTWFKVTVKDVEAPVITLTGDNPQTIEVGSAYSELDATVTDNDSSPITLNIDATNVVTSVIGSYSVTYNATDAAGNVATQVVRTVDVIEATEPEALAETDVCTNIDGIQTAVPDGMHINATGHECVNYMLGGAPAPSGNGGVVLGIGTSTPLASWFEVEYAGSNDNDSGQVLGTETDTEATPGATVNPTTNLPKVGAIDWILTHKKISLGIAIVLIVISYLLFKKKKS